MGALKVLALGLFLASTPIVILIVFGLGAIDKEAWAVRNGYAFSTGMILLYLYPFVEPGLGSIWTRIDRATIEWICWHTCFTQIAIQIPHNIFAKSIGAAKGTMVSWPFYSYGLSDARWYEFEPGVPFIVELINWNDGLLGLLVFAALIQYWRSKRQDRGTVAFLVISTIFRDATLFRETVEYMYDHHYGGYQHTTTNELYRSHGIAILWLINGLWLVAPIITCVWGWRKFFVELPVVDRLKND